MTTSTFKRHQLRLTLLPVVFLTLLTGVLALQIRLLESSAAWVDHADLVIARMHSLRRSMVEQETGLQGYLLTRRPEFLEPYTRGRSEVGGQLAELERLVSNNPDQVARLRQLSQEENDWAAMTANRLDRQQNHDQIIANSLAAQQRMDHIRLLASQFIQQEDILRAGRSSHAVFLSGITLATLILMAASAAGTAVFYTRRLRRSEGQYRTLFDSIDEGFCIVEVIFDDSGKPVDYRFLETNPAFGKQTGLANAEGRTMRELAPKHEQYWFDHYGRVALTGESARFQNRAEELDRRWYDVYAFRFGRPENRQVGILFNDITERKRVDEALRESEERFRALYERAPLGIEQVMLDGRLRMVNRAQCAMLGYSESEMLSKTFEEITHPEDRPREAALLQRLLSGEVESYSLEKRYLRKNGSPVWVSISSSLVRSRSGSPAYRITVVEDITTRKQAERALIRAEKLSVTGRMASTMAHEINNPLGAALNALYLAALDNKLSGPTSEYLDLAQRELERVAHATKQTLGFYRETGEPAKVDLREVAESVLNLYAPKLGSKGIRVETQYLTEARVSAIEGEVRQILSNLISNSIDAISQHGCIRLRVAGPLMMDKNRPALRLTVCDNGSGIEPQHVKQIFEPFFTTKQAMGTGLGLWVTQQLAKKHEGKIMVRSKPGQWTVFHVFLPVERRNPERLAEDQPDLGVKASA
jgi:PAS domain S-box-containing protein